MNNNKRNNKANARGSNNQKKDSKQWNHGGQGGVSQTQQTNNYARKQSKVPVPSSSSKQVMEARMLTVLNTMVGKPCSVYLKGNVVVEGNLATVSMLNQFNLVIEDAQEYSLDGNKKIEESKISHETLIIQGNQFERISSPDHLLYCELEFEAMAQTVGTGTLPHGEGMGFGGDITQRGFETNRHLEVAFLDDDACADPLLDHNANPQDLGKWDQFTANQERFGLDPSAEYSEDFYTTKLNVHELTPAQREKADRVAKEIESKPIHSTEANYTYEDNVDEGFLYSDVAYDHSTGNQPQPQGAWATHQRDFGGPTTYQEFYPGQAPFDPQVSDRYTGHPGSVFSRTQDIPEFNPQQPVTNNNARQFNKHAMNVGEHRITELKSMDALNLEPAVSNVNHLRGELTTDMPLPLNLRGKQKSLVKDFVSDSRKFESKLMSRKMNVTNKEESIPANPPPTTTSTLRADAPVFNPLNPLHEIPIPVEKPVVELPFVSLRKLLGMEHSQMLPMPTIFKNLNIIASKEPPSCRYSADWGARGPPYQEIFDTISLESELVYATNPPKQ